MFETADIVIAIESGIIIAMVLHWLLKKPDLDSEQSRKRFLKKYEKTTIKGWKQIYEHLETMHKDYNDSNECPKCYTRIQYKSLVIKIAGSLSVDQTLMILSEWEVSLSVNSYNYTYLSI